MQKRKNYYIFDDIKNSSLYEIKWKNTKLYVEDASNYVETEKILRKKHIV